MANHYTILVENKSGNNQNYAIFSEVPKVDQTPQSTIWTNVMTVAHAADSQFATFNISKQFQAVCGSYQKNPGVGVDVSVIGTKNVTLGAEKDDGTTTPGTTLGFTVAMDTPQYTKDSSTDAPATTFQITTTSDFTYQDAVANNWFVGLGGAMQGGSPTAAATFIPEPSVTYNVQPIVKYYITFGSYQAGKIINVEKLGGKVLVDFTKPPNSVKIVHGENGKLVIQKQ